MNKLMNEEQRENREGSFEKNRSSVVSFCDKGEMFQKGKEKEVKERQEKKGLKERWRETR